MPELCYVGAYSFEPSKPSELLKIVRSPKTESRSSKECEFLKSGSLEEEMVTLDEICRRSHLPRKSRKPSAFRSARYRLPKPPFPEDWDKRIHIQKKGYEKRNWFKRIHP